ncbi:MAG: DNA internalization-related competence protein ComEC/Rec2 [Chloroflexi bacterium]|nr:DNA internalization-related competence protein ComEC/Rec2 [Chloroflexota bacterium]
MPILYLSLTWLAGILLGAKLNWHFSLALIGLVPLPLLFVTRQRRKEIVLASLCLVTLFAGVSYFGTTIPVFDENHIQFYNDKGVTEVTGLVSADPENGDKTTRLRLSDMKIRQNGEWRDVSGSALLLVPKYPAYRYGDIVLADGELETPPQLDDPSTSLRTGFDYRGYLANQGIYAVMSFPKMETLKPGWGFAPLSWVYRLRHNMALVLVRVLPEPQASLAQGIVLGIRSGIPATITDQFSHTGTAHLLAISGLHLSIVAGMLVSLGLAVFGQRHNLHIWLALGVVWLYAVITGLHAPVIRASIMISFFFAADLAGRQRSSLIALVFAAALMAGVNPQVLRDASFQMSFMAMAGLFFITPGLQSFGKRWIDTAFEKKDAAASMGNFVVDSFSVSLGAIAGVWPLIAYYFGTISWVGPAATFLVIFSVPGIIVLGALAGIAGLFFLPLAQAIAWFAWVFISYLLLAVKIFDPSLFTQLDSFDVRLVWAYYGTFALALLLINNRAKLTGWISKSGEMAARLPVKWIIPSLLVLSILVWLVAATMPDDKLRVTFFDVGQGDAMLVSKGSQQILVDGGPDARTITMALGRQMPFWDRTIDLVVVTHPHSDHITGLLEVLRRYRVKQVLYPDLEDDSTLFRQWLRQLEENRIESLIAKAGQQITFGEMIIDVLNPSSPPLKGTGSDGDNNGVVLRLRAGEVSFLLTADTMWEAELDLISRRAILPSTVLKAGHHGSATSTSPEFLAVARPQVAVISSGAGNDFGHPNAQVLERLVNAIGQANVYRTDEQGDIMFTTDGERLWVKVER